MRLSGNDPKKRSKRVYFGSFWGWSETLFTTCEQNEQTVRTGKALFTTCMQVVGGCLRMALPASLIWHNGSL